MFTSSLYISDRIGDDLLGLVARVMSSNLYSNLSAFLWALTLR